MMDMEQRIFSTTDFIRPSDDLPIRSVVLETAESVIVVWHVKPGQNIPAHIHPHGQDTWTVLSGEADYYLGNALARRIKPHDIVVAQANQVHGAEAIGDEPLLFVSVVAPGNSGYALASAD